MGFEFHDHVIVKDIYTGHEFIGVVTGVQPVPAAGGYVDFYRVGRLGNVSDAKWYEEEIIRPIGEKSEEGLTMSNDQTVKADAGKLRLTLVPREIIRAIARARMYGLKKYGDAESWRSVSVERYRDALFRHLLAYLDDPYGVDEESGLSHLDHLGFNVAVLCELEKGEKHGQDQV